MAKFDLSKLKVGATVTLSNGAKAKVVSKTAKDGHMFKRLQITSGPTEHTARGPSRSISLARASAAFKKSWRSYIREATSPRSKGVRVGGMAKDIAFCSPRKLTHTRSYLTDPRHKEFQGYDCGAKRYNQSAKAKAHWADARHVIRKGDKLPASTIAKRSATRSANAQAVKRLHYEKLPASAAQLAHLRTLHEARRGTGKKGKKQTGGFLW
jgi:hypothetical protein